MTHPTADSIIGDGDTIMATRYTRPKTFNSLVVEPAYPAGVTAAKRMAAVAAEGARERREWRDWAKTHAERSLTVSRAVRAITGPVIVTVRHFRVNRAHLPDTGSPIHAAKAVVDGLVDAGLLPGDGPDVVTRLTFEAPTIRGIDGLQVIVQRIPDGQQTLL